MADNRTMAQMLQALIEGYEDAIVVPPINANNFELKQTLINLVQSNQFTGKQDPHNHLRFFNKVTSTFRHPEVPNTSIKLLLFPFSLEGEARTWLDKEPPRSILTWDDLVSKFINQFFPPSKTTYLRNKITTFYQEPNETFNEAWERFKELLRQCPHHGFSELHQLDTFYNSLNTNDQDALDSAAGGNFLDKMPRDGLAIIESKSIGVLKTVFEKLRQRKTMCGSEALFKTSRSNLQKKSMANVTSLLTSLCNNFKNSASTSNSGTLPSQTVTNPRQQINAITTRSGKTLEGPSTPLVPTPVVSNPQKEPEQNPETSTEKVQNPNLENTAHVPPPEEEDSIFIEIPKPKAKKTVNVEIQDLNSPRPNQSKLPYPERMKVRENDKPSAQHSRFLKMFKQLRLEIGLKDALVEMPKFNKWLSSLLRNKEKLEEIAITTVNAECSAIIMNKVPEKLKDPGKFLIPCALQELDRTSALADSGASINLLPHSIYKKLGLEALTPTRMTLELANRSITHPMGIAEDVVVRVDGFTFLADFVVVNFEPDPRVPIILGRPFLRTAKALIDLYEETLTLRVGKEELVYYADKSEKKSILFTPFLSSPVKTSDNLEEFVDELTLLKKDIQEGNFQDHSNPLFEFDDNFKSSTINPLFDEMERMSRSKIPTNDREFGNYLSLMTVLCEISTSQSQENVHANQSSIYQGHLPVSPIPVEDSEHAQEEIDIFLVPDDLIPPGVENDDSEDEVNELPNLDHQYNPSIPRPLRNHRLLRNVLNRSGIEPTISEDSRVRCCTDISKITRKPSKTGKHGHENGRACKSRKPKKLKIALDLLSEKAQGVTITDCHAGNQCVHICDPTAKSNDPIIEGIQGM
ncbi:reverse transcriptase domain-containing protein [Tanacetum coccineum]